VGQDRIAESTWLAAAKILMLHEMNWCFAVGCAVPAGVTLETALPNYPYKYSGPQGVGFAAVGLLAQPKASALRVPEWSRTSRTCWVMVNSWDPWVGFYVPPLGSATERERADIVRGLFEEAAAVKRTLESRREASQGAVQIWGIGDLNPTDDLLQVYEALLLEHGYVNHIPEGTPTHVLGRRLDVLWGAPPATWQDPLRPYVTNTVHDGRTCRASGCTIKACGDHGSLVHSTDLDHFPSGG
jgi:hypothetical protein